MAHLRMGKSHETSHLGHDWDGKAPSLLQLNCPCRQAQLCYPLLSFLCALECMQGAIWCGLSVCTLTPKEKVVGEAVGLHAGAACLLLAKKTH
eukprot:1159960-Pelagomonas_calceolata.AAC.3